MAIDIRPIIRSELSEIDKALVALLYCVGEHSSAEIGQLASILEGAGSPKINRTRLRQRFERDRRVVKHGSGFRLAPRRIPEVHNIASPFMQPLRPADPKSFIDSSLFDSAHNYVRNIVQQINVSYSTACYDCTAVMVRRLAETLMVDVFEKQGAVDEITDANGDLVSMSGMIKTISSTTRFTVARQTRKALPYLKDIGDWSAHNRRYRAQKSDLDASAQHLRLAAADLLHLAGQDGA